MTSTVLLIDFHKYFREKLSDFVFTLKSVEDTQMRSFEGAVEDMFLGDYKRGTPCLVFRIGNI